MDHCVSRAVSYFRNPADCQVRKIGQAYGPPRFETLNINRNTGFGKGKYITASILILFCVAMFIYTVLKRW